MPPSAPGVSQRPTAQKAAKLTVEAVRSLANPALIDYLRERGISDPVARTHCREVHYRVGDKSYFAIGFQNDAGGWELRNPYFKSCVAPKALTTHDRGSDTCMVFEGFMDYLSYLTLQRTSLPQINAVILNSVVNVPKAIPFLGTHKTVHAFLDNDESGRKAFARIEAALPLCEVVDQSGFYRPYKDVNAYLQAVRKLPKPAHGNRLQRRR